MRERISLPDEVLMLRTGSDRDKALLLYALIQHAPGLSPADKEAAEILFTDQDSLVQQAAPMSAPEPSSAARMSSNRSRFASPRPEHACGRCNDGRPQSGSSSS